MSIFDKRHNVCYTLTHFAAAFSGENYGTVSFGEVAVMVLRS